MSDRIRVRGDLTERGALIERHTGGERLNHWLLAGFFFLAGLSGLALFHPAVFWLQSLFGGGPWTRILHPIFGLAMILFFQLLSLTVVRHMLLRARDWAWLRQIGDVVSNRHDRLPEVGRYNAGQKLVWWIVGACLFVLLLTGVPMWRAFFSQYFPITAIRLSAVLHDIAAVLLICTVIVHIDSAIWVRGSIKSMTRGWVTPGWAWKHHRAWYRDIAAYATRPRTRTD